MKAVFKRILCLAVSAAVVCSLLTASLSVSAASAFTSRSDFIWGVNGHNKNYKSYPLRSTEQQIKLAAELGVKYYRFNYNPKSSADFQYMDYVLDLCNRYYLQLMLVVDDNSMDAQSTYNMYKSIATRYNGKIPYIQVFNEQDVYAMSGGGNGDLAGSYNASKLAELLPKFQSAFQALKEYGSQMKTVVNISYRHTYIFQWLKDNGMSWDITGLDWYKNMGYEDETVNGAYKTGGYDYIIPRLEAFGKPIIICETNVWPINKGYKYSDDVTYLPKSMEYVYNNYKSVIGMFFYELLDEPQYEISSGNDYEVESHFGLVNVNSDFSIGAVKPVYSAIQKLLGGGTVTPKPATVTEPADNQSSQSSTTSHASSQAGTSASSAVQSTDSSDVSSDVSETETSSETDASSEDEKSESTDTSAKAEKKSNKTLIIVLCVAGVLVLAGGGVLAFFLIKKRKNGLADNDAPEKDDGESNNTDENQ